MRKMDGEKGFYQDVTRRAFISRTGLMTLVTLGGNRKRCEGDLLGTVRLQ